MILMYSSFSCRIKYHIPIGRCHSPRSVHSCNNVIEITAKENNILAYIRTSRFVVTTWHICFYDQLDKTCEMRGLKLCLRIEITAKGNNISAQVAYIRTCRFVDTTWHICFYDQLDKACEMCGLKFCL